MDQRVELRDGRLPWSSRSKWAFPADDTRLMKSFIEGPGDLDTALPMLLPHLAGRRTCIQAGGCIGIWPLRLAQFFERVLTFEPQADNFACLLHNTAGLENVSAMHAALGNGRKPVHMERAEIERGNSGAYYTAPGGDIPVQVIDDLNLREVDLIYLDVEGGEAPALRGATDTIRRCRPVIGVEDKNLHSGQRAVDLLVEQFGYSILGRPFSLDVILLP